MMRTMVLGGLAALFWTSAAAAQGDVDEFRIAGQALEVDDLCHVVSPIGKIALGAAYLDAVPTSLMLKAGAEADMESAAEALQAMGCDHKDALGAKNFAKGAGDTAARLWLAYGEAVATIAEKEKWASSPLAGSAVKLTTLLAPLLPTDQAFVTGLRAMATTKARAALAATCDRVKPGCPDAPADLKRADAERWLKIVASVGRLALQ